VPTGYTQSYPTSGASCAGHTGASGIGWAVTLTSGLLDSGNDFGNFRNATISGMKFKDADAGGDKDTGEIGLSGWEIHLFGTDGSGGTVHQHTTTDANGNYSFTVKPGTYTLCETISGKPGWVQTFPSGTACTGHTHGGTITPGAAGYTSVSVTSGGTAGSKDFGNTPLSRATVTFESLADLPGGSDATRATSISCTDKDGNSVGSNANSNTLTTSSVKTNQSALTCTVTFVDP
jgi:large repetitive protein